MPDPVDATEVSDLPLDDLVACHECDLLMRKPALALGEKAQCPRCGYELYAHRHNVGAPGSPYTLKTTQIFSYLDQEYFSSAQTKSPSA